MKITGWMLAVFFLVMAGIALYRDEIVLACIMFLLGFVTARVVTR